MRRVLILFLILAVLMTACNTINNGGGNDISMPAPPQPIGITLFTPDPPLYTAEQIQFKAVVTGGSPPYTITGYCGNEGINDRQDVAKASGSGGESIPVTEQKGDDSGNGSTAVCGDLNKDGVVVDVSDYVYLFNYLYKKGPAPNPLHIADVNHDDKIDVGDIVYMNNYLWRGGPAPQCEKSETGNGIVPGSDGCGDTNYDGVINEQDVSVIMDYIRGEYTPDLYRLNVNGDDIVKEDDAVYLINFIQNRIPGQTLTCKEIPKPNPKCGDVNRDGIITAADTVFLVNYLYKGGSAPDPMWIANVNNADHLNIVDIADVVYLTNYVNKGGPAPNCPVQNVNTVTDTSPRADVIYPVTGNAVKSISISPEIKQLCGDVNNDGKRDVSDVVYLINYVYKGGPAPIPYKSGDINADGTVNSKDFIYLISYIYGNGPEPDCKTIVNPKVALKTATGCSDMNGDGILDSSDIDYLVRYLYSSGPAPISPATGNVNDDGIVDVSDVVYLINYLYKDGPEPVCPTETFTKFCVYSTSGKYTVKVDVTDFAGKTSSQAREITVLKQGTMPTDLPTQT